MIPVRDPAVLPPMLSGMPPVDEIVVVDVGGSLPQQPGLLLVRPAASGVGQAWAAGVRAASSDVVVILNGDGSTDPAEIPRFVGALVDGADVALGSRYTAGGRDLAGGRFRRWADRLLIWCVNVLLGVRRTDPGFGYAAFWRDTVPGLGLPSPGTDGWGAGPEIGPLLALRPAVDGLRVAEVAAVAYPPIRPAPRSERPRLRHWRRTVLRELSRRHRGGRHVTAIPHPRAERQLPVVNEVGYYRGRRVNETGAGRRALDRRAVEALGAGRSADERLSRERWDRNEPIWAPAARHAPADHHLTNGTPPVWPDRQPRSTAPWHLFAAPAQPTPGPEVGARRRRIRGNHQTQPDLRVINGEGAGPTSGRRARLRSVKKPPV